MSLHRSPSLAMTEPTLLTRRTTAFHFDRHSSNLATGLVQTFGTTPGIIFLGYLYPLNSIPRAPRQPDPESLCQGLGSEPDPARLAALLTFNPPSLRSMYQFCMGALDRMDKAGQLPHEMSEPLLIERKLWGMYDSLWLERYVTSNITKVRDGLHEHWLWHKRGKERPQVTWRTTPSVPVHRLLWHDSRPLELLLPDERLRKDPEVCPDAMYRNCVNPAHFRHALKLTADRYPAARRTTWERNPETSYKYRWDASDIKEESHPLGLNYGVPVIRCPLGHRFPETVQRNMRDKWYPMSPNYDPDQTGTSRCHECWETLRRERGLDANDHMRRRPRTLAQPNRLLQEQADRDRAYRDYKRTGEENGEDAFMRQVMEEAQGRTHNA